MIKKLIFFLIFSLAFSSSLFAETILLKSGKSIEAKIIEKTDKHIKIDLVGVNLTYYREDIESIDGIPFNQKKENLSLSTTTPTVSSSLSIDTNQLRSLLKELGYPEQSLPALERELLNFLNKIDFYSWKAQLQEAKTNPYRLQDLLRQMGKVITKELSGVSGTHPLLLTLVNSLSKDDMLYLIETSPVSLETKEKNKQNIFACSAYTQLGSIILSLAGLDVKAAYAPTHVFNYLSLNAQQTLFVDFAEQIFEIIELKGYYETQGTYLVLKPQYQLSAQRVKEIFEQFKRLPSDERKFTQKEILNIAYFYLFLTENFSATAVIQNNFGTIYTDKGDFNQARTYFNQALKFNPNLALTYYNLGIIGYKKGDLNQAIAEFNQALQLNPNYADAYGNRGLAYADKGDLNQALADYNKALQLNPNYVDTYCNRGAVYADKGDFNQAIMDFNQALQLNPNYAEAYNNRGLAYYYDKGDLNQVIADYNKALQLNPNFVLAYNNRGLAYADKGDLNQALADYNKALQLNPNYANTYNNRATVYFLKGDYLKAWEDVQKAEALGLQVNPEFLQNLRRALGKE